MSLPFLCTITELCQPKTSSTQNQKYLQSKKSKKAMQIDNVMWRHKHTLHYKLTMSWDVTKILCITNWQCHVTSQKYFALQIDNVMWPHKNTLHYKLIMSCDFTKILCIINWQCHVTAQKYFALQIDNVMWYHKNTLHYKLTMLYKYFFRATCHFIRVLIG